MMSIRCMLFSLLLLTAGKYSFSQVSTYNLNSNWSFSQHGKSDWLPAKVPGCVHTDLLDNRRISDPYFRANERQIQWVGEKDWEYKSSFTVPQALLQKEHQELVFKGLDTYADVFLNDKLVLTTNNMHREWRLDAKKDLKAGENTLRVHFKNIFKTDMPKYLEAPYKAQIWPNNDQSDIWLSVYARKAGYEYGWDWGPRLITSGIWRPVYLEGWNTSKINNVQLIQKGVNASKAELSAVVEVESSGQKDALITVKNQNKIVAQKRVDLVNGINKVQLDYNILNPKLWWTNGLGTPNLYTFQYSLQDGKKELDNETVTAGLRSLKVVRQKDKDGTSFYFVLNGVPVFIKGANYIPIDNFVNRVTPDRYETVINSARDANMNMLRVWGGGIYENDIFYDLCDKKGILVWQDFLFACGMFPANKEFVDNVKQEVVDNVTRLRNHPSLAIWCGNNENAISWFGWGWRDKYSKEVQKEYEANMFKLFDVEIPAALATVDTTRFYHPSSPNTGFNGVKPNEGDSHYYGVWTSGEPFEAYDKNVARFMSEYGFQSFPEYKSIEQFTAPEDRSLNSQVMFFHQKAKADETKEDFGNKNIAKYLDRYFQKPVDFKSFLYLSQVQQAKAIRTAIEAHRRNMPFCMGTMYWQLNDCWPVASWSSTDYYGRWKAVHYMVKKAYQKEIISVMKENGKLKVHIASDRLKDQSANLELKLMDFSGKVLSSSTQKLTLAPNTSKVYFETDSVSLLKAAIANNAVWVIKLKSGSEELAEKYYYFKHEKDLQFSAPSITYSIRKSGGKYLVDVKSDKLAKAVFLSLKNKDGFFSDNYFDLLPNEAKTVELIPAKAVEGLELKDLDAISLVDSYTVK